MQITKTCLTSLFTLSMQIVNNYKTQQDKLKKNDLKKDTKTYENYLFSLCNSGITSMLSGLLVMKGLVTSSHGFP